MHGKKTKKNKKYAPNDAINACVTAYRRYCFLASCCYFFKRQGYHASAFMLYAFLKEAAKLKIQGN